MLFKAAAVAGLNDPLAPLDLTLQMNTIQLRRYLFIKWRTTWVAVILVPGTMNVQRQPQAYCACRRIFIPLKTRVVLT
jgi:hypothetical protein